MSADPQVWHYGLMAQFWAHFLFDAPELAFYQKQIERYGEPVLDLACGTGRLLQPLLHRGIEVHGCDISPDMLALCREKAAIEGLAPQLYQQAMHQLDLQHTYKTIYICGSFGLAGGRANNLDMLRRCYKHLDHSGALVFNIEAEYNDPEAWLYWLKQKRAELPEPWPEEGQSKIASDGAEYVSRFRTLEIDPLEQSYLRQVRLEKWVQGKLVANEEYTLRGYMFFRNEVELMLMLVGFQDIIVLGDYTDEPATADHRELVFVARK